MINQSVVPVLGMCVIIAGPSYFHGNGEIGH